jgi:pyroglutamyl-peptidase
MKRVLVSGFTTFGKHSENSSEIIVNHLKQTKLEGIDLRTCILPVAFSTSFDLFKVEIDSFKPEIVIALGLAANRTKIEIEKIAVNLIDCDVPDNEGIFLQDKFITEGGASAYFTTLPIQGLRALQYPFPVSVSYSAGTYVCNYLMYRLMEFTKQTNIKAGFIHLPPLKDNSQEILSTIKQIMNEC